jgi:hypothetical protein
MIALQSDVRVYLACGYTDMRKGMQGLAMLVQQVLAEDLGLWLEGCNSLVHLAGIDDSVRLGGPSRICHSPAEI